MTLAVILTMTACEVTSPVAPPPVVEEEEADTPDDFMRAAQAAAPADAARLYLNAARGFFALGDMEPAKAAAALIDATQLPAAEQFAWATLSARLALHDGNVSAAEATLRTAVPTTEDERRDWQLLNAEVLGASGRYADAAESVMSIPLPDEPQAAQVQNDLTWRLVRRTPGYLMREKATMEGQPTIAAGWWQLAAALESGFDLAGQREALARWQRRHPDHPAAVVPPRQLAALTAALETRQRVGLFLPLTGPLAAAGQAVRDGFLAAFYHVASDRTVRLYDTNGADVAALYEQAMADGIEIIVGPLDKPSVSTLNALPFRQVPVIALNTLVEPLYATASQGLVQFSLAIEDESRNVADRLAADQMERIAIIHSFADWSGRARDAFEERWAINGGATPLVGDFIDVKNVTATVGEVLQVDASTERAADVARTIGQAPEFVPRRRRDLDALVVFVDNVQARALKPAMAYHFARDLPVYAVSQAIQPVTPRNLRDLDGLRVCLIPWLVADDALKAAVLDAFDAADGVLAPFFAFGVDAFRLADRLSLIADDSDARLAGATGVLTLTPDGRVERRLTWAVVTNGTLSVLPQVVATPTH